jgi:site-specific recombinase XerD
MSTDLALIRSADGAPPREASILAGQLAPSSMQMYARDFRAYLTYALDPATLARWRALLAANTSLSPNTINRMLSAVKHLIKEAAVQGYVAHETAKAFADIAGVKVVALKERTKCNGRTRIDPLAMRQLCEAPNQTTMKGLRDAAMLATLASSGLRVSELASLTVGQIIKKGSGCMLSVRGKNDREYREAPLSREAYQLLMQWITRRPVVSEYVFTSFGGRGQRASAAPLSTINVWCTVQATLIRSASVISSRMTSGTSSARSSPSAIFARRKRHWGIRALIQPSSSRCSTK